MNRRREWKIETLEEFPLTITGVIRRNEFRLRDIKRKEPLT